MDATRVQSAVVANSASADKTGAEMSDDVVIPMLSLEFGGKHEQPIVRVSGHLTTDTAGAFTTSLVAGGVSFGPAVVVDLSGVTRIDRCGLSALEICERSLAEEGSQLILKRAS